MIDLRIHPKACKVCGSPRLEVSRDGVTLILQCVTELTPGLWQLAFPSPK
jgi:hypothetical protein